MNTALSLNISAGLTDPDGVIKLLLAVTEDKATLRSKLEHRVQRLAKRVMPNASLFCFVQRNHQSPRKTLKALNHGFRRSPMR